MQTIIGAPANGLQNYHLYGKNGKEMSIKDGGFSQVNLLQDVDAYNISRLYNLADTRLYAAFEDYYNVSKHYKRRYLSLFILESCHLTFHQRIHSSAFL